MQPGYFIIFAFGVFQDWEELGKSATGPGLCVGGGHSEGPSVALDGKGHPVVAWMEEGEQVGIHLRRWDGSAWVELGGSASGLGISGKAEAGVPGVAVDGEGRPVVAWIGRKGDRAQVYVRQWNGREWQELGGSASGDGVSRAPRGAAGLALRTEAKGCVTVQWQSRGVEGPPVLHLRQWDGRAWQELGGSATGKGLTVAGGRAQGHSLALDVSGHPSVAWVEELGEDRTEVYFRRWNGSAWGELGGSASAGLTLTKGLAESAMVALDASGAPMVAWNQKIQGVWQVHFRRWTRDVWLEPKGSATGGGVSRSAKDSILMGGTALVADGSDRPVLGWIQDSSDPKVPATLVLRRWDGTAWSPLGELSSGGHLSFFDLAAGPAGSLVAVWSWSKRMGHDGRIHLKRRTRP